MTIISFCSVSLLAQPGTFQMNNKAAIQFRNSSGALDGTEIIRAGGNALRVKYFGNKLIFDALDDFALELRDAKDDVMIQLSPKGSITLNQLTEHGIRFVRAGHDPYEIGLRNAKGLYFTNTESGEHELTLDGNGRVGIGTMDVPAGYKLGVDGKLIAEEVRVEMAGDGAGEWPDYVFQKDYPLLPLSELEKTIYQKGHLPGIPSAADVEKEGIELGDMNRRLLKKVEELTLYIIEMKKEHENLKKRIEVLEKIK